MSMKSCKYIPGALVVLGILFGVFLVNPACFAGGAVVLVPAEDTDVPQGSYIPDERIKKIEKKVREYKAKMKGTSTEQQQEQQPLEEIPKPNGTNE